MGKEYIVASLPSLGGCAHLRIDRLYQTIRSAFILSFEWKVENEKGDLFFKGQHLNFSDHPQRTFSTLDLAKENIEKHISMFGSPCIYIGRVEVIIEMDVNTRAVDTLHFPVIELTTEKTNSHFWTRQITIAKFQGTAEIDSRNVFTKKQGSNFVGDFAESLATEIVPQMLPEEEYLTLNPWGLISSSEDEHKNKASIAGQFSHS